MKGLFVTATDTNVGKTMVTGAIAAACRERDIHIGVFKPLASGGILDEAGRLVSEDASFLMKAAQIDEAQRQEVNEICLQPALTPAVAAKLSGVVIDIEALAEHIEKRAVQYDMVLVEGVGGLAAPLWEDYRVVDFMVRLGLPGVLVGDAGLGSINHVVLSAAYAEQNRASLHGIILNRWPAEHAGVLETSNTAYIEQMTKLPIWGRLPCSETLNVERNCTDFLAQTAEKNLAVDQIIACMAANGGKV